MSDAMPEFPSLTVHGGAIDGYEMKLSQGITVIIGSGRLANMRLDHPDIELAHVKVAWDENGISMIDNGSRKGTWVNGEPVETDGAPRRRRDRVRSSGCQARPRRRSRSASRRARVPEPPPPPPPTPEEIAARSAAEAAAVAARTGRGKGRARRRKAGPALPDWRILALVAGVVVLLAVVGWLVNRLFFTAPQVDSVHPAQAEPGQTVAVAGKRFDGDAEDNLVWFADRSVTASSIEGGALQVKVPAMPHGGTVRLFVETGSGRSRPASFAVLMPLNAVTLEPAGALPGDEVTLHGSGFTEGAIRHRGRRRGEGGRRPRRAPCASRCRRSRARRAAGATSSRRSAIGARSRSPSTSAGCRSSCRSSPREAWRATSCASGVRASRRARTVTP